MRRRTPGLRREEVAQIAGVSASWYTWLEQGREIRVSVDVLGRISRALQLNGDEITYLFELAGLEAPHALPEVVLSVNPTLQRVLDRMEFVPAYVHNHRWDRIAWNKAALALMGDFSREPLEDRNTVWRTFANPIVRAYTEDWAHIAQVVIAEFHASVSRYFDDPWLMGFVARLSEASPEFRLWWARRDVIRRREEKTVIKHATAGALHLERSIFQIPYDPGLSLVLFTPIDTENSPARLKALVESFSSPREKSVRKRKGTDHVDERSAR